MTEKTAQKEPGKKPVPSKKPKPQQEVVVQISLSELHPFPDHPFQVREDAYYGDNAYCVRIKGVLVFNKGCPYVCKQFLLGLQAMKKNIIDLYMKSGLYITESVKRLYQSEQMKKQFPDPKERLRHIFEK